MSMIVNMVVLSISIFFVASSLLNIIVKAMPSDMVSATILLVHDIKIIINNYNYVVIASFLQLF